MLRKLIIILANTDITDGAQAGAPVYQASVAAAMSYAVEVVCTGNAVRLLKAGVASGLRLKGCDTKTVHDFIKEAHTAGVKFFCCAPGLEALDIHGEEDLIPECSGVVGSAHLVEQIMSDDTRVLTF